MTRSRRVRLFGAYAPGQLRAKDAEEALVEALSDPAPIVRMGAAEGLGAIRARGAVPHLRKVLDADTDKYVRLHAVESLVLLGDVESRARVREVLKTIPWRVRGSSRWKRFRRARRIRRGGRAAHLVEGLTE